MKNKKRNYTYKILLDEIVISEQINYDTENTFNCISEIVIQLRKEGYKQTINFNNTNNDLDNHKFTFTDVIDKLTRLRDNTKCEPEEKNCGCELFDEILDELKTERIERARYIVGYQVRISKAVSGVFELREELDLALNNIKMYEIKVNKLRKYIRENKI